MKRNFYSDLEFGSVGEQAVMALLSSRGWHCWLIKDQKPGDDGDIACDHDGITVIIEVKRQKALKYENKIVLEIDGWLAKEKFNSDIIVFNYENRFIFVRYQDLKQFWFENSRKYELSKSGNNLIAKIDVSDLKDYLVISNKYYQEF